MTEREFKDSLYEQFARIGKAICTPKRLEILDLLGQGERSVEVLAKAANMSMANTSQHLQELRSARLVESRREGPYIHYRLADAGVWRLWTALRDLGTARLAEVEQLLRAMSLGEESLETVDRATLWRLAQEGSVTVLDVRPAEEYGAGHIPGAVSVPLGELEFRLSELPRDQEVVAYCRGPYCLLAVEAVELLRGHGYASRRLQDGFPEWRAEGLPIQVGI